MVTTGPALLYYLCLGVPSSETVFSQYANCRKVISGLVHYSLDIMTILLNSGYNTLEARKAAMWWTAYIRAVKSSSYGQDFVKRT